MTQRRLARRYELIRANAPRGAACEHSWRLYERNLD